MEPDKAWWRAQAKLDRFGSEPDHAAYCRQLERFCRTVPEGRWIVLYHPMTGEVDLTDLAESNRTGNRRWALTRTPDEGLALTVHPWESSRERHRYGFQQPRSDSPVVPDSAVGAVLVPGLAFDRDGNRLGRGKGYYDRFLARLERDGVFFVGITGDYLVDRLPTDRFDVAMTHLAFSHGIYPVPVGSDWSATDGGRSS